MVKALRSRPIIVGIVLVVVVGLGLVARSLLGARAASTQALTWATGQASLGRIEVTVTGSAALQPGKVADVRTMVSGTVRRILVTNGDVVTEGTPLLELENESVLLDWEQARLTYEEESEALAVMQSGTTSSSTARRSAELRVQQALLDLNSKQAQVDRLTVRAEAAGRIGSLDVKAGEEVKAGTQLLTLLEGPRAEAVLQVSETDIGRIAAGDRAGVILGPLPEAHTITIHIYEPSVYNLRVGDLVRATIEGKWVGLTNSTVGGRVVEINGGATFFEVKCRLSSVPSTVPGGATVGYMQIFPTGDPGDATVLTATGKLAIETDVWGLEAAHADGHGLGACVVEVSEKGTKSAQGDVTYQVTLAMDEYPAQARDGQSAHACVWPRTGGAVAGVTTLTVPAKSVTTASGGQVSAVAVKPGDVVAAGQLLVRLTNDSLLHQLEQAVNDLTVAEENLAKLDGSGDADRKERLQEIRTRQAELAMEARLQSVESLTVTAQQDGVVSGLNEDLAVGRTLPSGTSVCRVLNYSEMLLTISIDELEVPLVQPGMVARVTVDALPGKTFPAEVIDVAQEGTYQSGVSRFSVRLRVQASPQLRAQMTAIATIEIAEKADALLVPAEAVAFLGDGNGEVSLIGAGGAVSQARVKIGLYNDAYVEVLSGLKAGDVVITGVADGNSGSGMGGLIPGQPGMVVPGAGGSIRPGTGTNTRPGTGGQTGPR